MHDPRLDDEALSAVTDALARGRKIEAIKLYREAAGVGLKDAKEAVERLASSMPTPPEGIRPAGGCAGVVVSLALVVAVLALV